MERVRQKRVAAAYLIKRGHGLEEGTQIGPVVSKEQLQQSLDYVDIARAKGTELQVGGDRMEWTTKGMHDNREERFIPITCIIKVGRCAEALSIASDRAFGLTVDGVPE